MFFDNWNSILKILVVGSLAYVYLVALLRISGKRTLSQMNAFDFIVTVALGSTLATILLSKDTALLEGIFALTLLVLLQFVVAMLSSKFKIFNKLVKSEPEILFYKGKFHEKKIKELRVAKEEIFQAMRGSGILYLEEVEAVILETNGNFSILKSSEKSGERTIPQEREF